LKRVRELTAKFPLPYRGAIHGEGVVAADISSAVEGRRPAARKKPTNFSTSLKSSTTSGYSHGFIRRAGCPGSTAGEDACRYVAGARS
jgi:hypothetical protein